MIIYRSNSSFVLPRKSLITPILADNTHIYQGLIQRTDVPLVLSLDRFHRAHSIRACVHALKTRNKNNCRSDKMPKNKITMYQKCINNLPLLFFLCLILMTVDHMHDSNHLLSCCRSAVLGHDGICIASQFT